ncbi:MAG: SRPBCC family protein [Woeseiaceae bacterium]|nr:SRPBCC family protein [Woeseiaceae bacterium]
MPNTVKLHRVFATRPEKVYRAFLEPDALASWLPPFGFTCTVHELDAKTGGKYRMTFRNFTTGDSHSFGGTYLKLIPNETIVYTDAFENPDLPGTMTVKVTLKQVSVGTDMNVIQEDLPDQIPLEACYLGWQESLQKLARLVEPDIKGK